MASLSESTVAEYQALVDSLRYIAKMDARLLDDRAKLLDVLTALTERNEMLVQEQSKMKEKYEGEHKMQLDIMAALEQQNYLLKQRVEDQEDEISGLEKELAGLRDQTSTILDNNLKGVGPSDETRVDVERNAAGTSANVRAKVKWKMSDHKKKKVDQELVEAARQGNMEGVEVLLAKGADVNAVDWLGKTALTKAACEDHFQIVEVLLANGANINATDNLHQTALTYAASIGNFKTVNVLVSNGANINTKNINGWTALMVAASSGHNDVLEALIDRGANSGIILCIQWTLPK